MKLQKMTLNINGADRTFICNPEKDSLADVVRRLGLTGTKIGCGHGRGCHHEGRKDRERHHL